MATHLILAALLSQAAPALPDIEVGRANWTAFQRMETRLALPTPQLVGRVQAILSDESCSLPGQRPSRFDFTVNYAVKFGGMNQVERILVEDMGCELIELLVGNMISAMLRLGHFELPAVRSDRWLANSVNFNLVT